MRSARTGMAHSLNLAQMCAPQMTQSPSSPSTRSTAPCSPTPSSRLCSPRYADAAGKADDAILASCPKQAPLTPTGRLDAVKARLQAMLDGVNAVKQPLQDFYVSLSDAQKAKLDTLTQPPAPSEQNAKTPKEGTSTGAPRRSTTARDSRGERRRCRIAVESLLVAGSRLAR